MYLIKHKLKNKYMETRNIQIAIISENNFIVREIEKIVNSKKGDYLSLEEYDTIKGYILGNKSDILNFEPENIPIDLLQLIENHELYYGFNENEIIRFLNDVQKLGYTFNYVDIATKDNSGMSHTFKPYSLRKTHKN